MPIPLRSDFDAARVVENDEAIFARSGAQSAPDLLGMQGKALRRSQQYRGANSGNIQALGNYLARGEDLRAAISEAGNSRIPLRGQHAAMHAFGAPAVLAKGLGNALGVFDRDAKGNCGPACQRAAAPSARMAVIAAHSFSATTARKLPSRTTLTTPGMRSIAAVSTSCSMAP